MVLFFGVLFGLFLVALLLDDESPFVQLDNRRFRPELPTTGELLNTRHEAALPSEIVAGRSVLDIGCALAATGKWVLDRGATSYTGVEPQKIYADTAAQLLSSYPQAEIMCIRGEEFLTKCNQQYDVVALIGVLHGQYNPLSMLEAACSVAKEYVCVETPGHDGNGPAMMPLRELRMPVAGRNAEFHGFGWRIAPSALSVMMEHLGFLPDTAVTYLQRSRYPRYSCRFRRGTSRTPAAADFVTTVDWDAGGQ